MNDLTSYLFKTNAFSVCEGLTGTLTLPASLQTVGSYSFFACKFSTIVNNSNWALLC